MLERFWAAIRKYVVPDVSDSNKRTRMLLRILSVVFAVSLWLFVTWDGTTASTRELTVPLKYVNLPDGFSISNTTRDISVILEGRVESLALLNRNSITATVNMSDLKPGKYRLPVQLEVPDSLRMVSYAPQLVDFELFRVIERTLRPSLAVTDDIPDNLSLGEVVITPNEVTVRGAEAEVLAIRRAEVRSNVADLRSGINRELPVVLVGDKGEVAGLIVQPRRVRVGATLTEATEEIRVPVRVSVIGNPGEGLEIGEVEVSPDVVTLQGAKSALEHISEIALSTIDVTGHTEDMNVVIPLETPAPGVSIVGADQASVRVVLHSALEQRTFFGVPVAVEGDSPYEEWRATPLTVSVTVESSIADRGAFDSDDPPVELYVDVTNVVSKQITLPILVRNLAPGMTLLRIDPDQVLVHAMTTHGTE